jgi:glycosyltransferase involved in cell wall biosynthesis
LDSLVRQQTNFPFEIVVGDDCSTDATPQICKEYQEKYPTCIKVILQEKNKGIAENYNDILRQCQGRYIATCDGDDFWCDAQKLQKQVDYMEQHKDIVVTYHDVVPVSEEGQITQESLLSSSEKKNSSSFDLMKSFWIVPVAICYRSLIVPEILRYMTSRVFNEDVFIISLLGNKGEGAYLSNINPSAYRQSNEGIWSRQNEVHKNLMRAGTDGELMLYYREKNNTQFCEYYKKRMITHFANIQNSEIIEKDLCLYKVLLKRYWRYIGLRNLMYYMRNMK